MGQKPNQIRTNVRAGLPVHGKSCRDSTTKRIPRDPTRDTCSTTVCSRSFLVTNTTVIPPTRWIASPLESSVLDEGSSVMRLVPLCIVIDLLRGFCSRAFDLNVGSPLTGIVMNVEWETRSTHNTGGREFGKSKRYMFPGNLFA